MKFIRALAVISLVAKIILTLFVLGLAAGILLLGIWLKFWLFIAIGIIAIIVILAGMVDIIIIN